MKTTILKATLLFVFGANTIFAQNKFKETIFGQTKEYNKINDKEIIRCASHEYDTHLKEKNPARNDKDFEKWIASKIQEYKKSNVNKRQTNAVITIPVVVHVLHNGQNVGTGSNISDLRVQSQITVLNQDFRRMLGTNGHNTNSNGADVEVEFCLVQQTPTGQATNGINRVNIRNLGITTNYYSEQQIETILKPRTIWDPNKYMNIWVGDFFGNQNSDLNIVLGYAQFPVRSGINGLFSDNSPNTDGVIIDYKCFGSSQIAGGSYLTGYNLGRTTTHEVGHYLGLRHVNGDNEDDCAVDAIDSNNDYCLDTPAQLYLHNDCNEQYDTCPAEAGLDNITNFMDYSNDSCLNHFTVNQKERIRAVLLNSPRRKFLSNNGACTARPANVSKDVSVIKSDLTKVDCSQYFTANVQLQNTGSVAITSAVINFSMNNRVVYTHNYTGNIAANATANFRVDNIAFANFSYNEVKTEVISVNGSNDDNLFNNVFYSEIQHTPNVTENRAALVFYSDGYLEEMSYNVVDNLGNLVANGTLPPTQVYNPRIVYLDNLVNGRCYTVTLTDSGRDGLRGLPVILLQSPFDEQSVLYEAYPMSSTLSFKFIKGASLSSEDFNSISSFGVYPNPANSVLNISIGDANLPKAYTIFNTLGQTIQTKTITSESDLMVNIESLSSGIYMIKVDAENGSQTVKFIKK